MARPRPRPRVSGGGDPSRVNVAILSAQDVADQAMDEFVAMELEEAEKAFHGAGIATRVLRMRGMPSTSSRRCSRTRNSD